MNEIMNAYIAMWKNYANFNGRTSVRSYWFAALGNFIVAILLAIIFGLLLFIGITISDTIGSVITILAIIAYTVYVIALIIPGISITVRRLHDAGFSGLMFLINFVPSVGQVALIVFCCLPSVEKDDYGTIDSQV